MLRNALFVMSLLLFGVIAGLGGYYAGGRSDAIDDTRPLMRLADRLIDRREGGSGLGQGREQLLLAVESGPHGKAVQNDGDVPEASAAMLRQTLAGRLAAERSDPSFSKIRQAGYASGLKTELSGAQVLALWLETVDMGRGPQGWIRGFYQASRSLYDRSPAELNDAEFLRLVAVATTPGKYRLDRPDPALEARVTQLHELLISEQAGSKRT
jgi:hypothetical protein